MSSPKWLLPKSGSSELVAVVSPREVPPASQGNIPRLASGSDSGFVQITAFALGLRKCEILCELLCNRSLYFSQVSGCPQNKHHWTSATNILGFHHPDAGFLAWEAQCGAQTFYSLQRTSAIVIILQFGGRLPKGMCFDYTASPPLLPILSWFFFF